MLLLPIGRWYFRWTLFVVLNLGDDDDDEVVLVVLVVMIFLVGFDFLLFFKCLYNREK